MRSNILQRAALICMALSAVLSSFAQVADAQNQKIAMRTPNMSRGPMEALRQEPRDLPYVPQITPPGSQFLYGMKKLKETGGTSLSLRYGTMNPPGTTLKFYQDSLKQYGWTITSSTSQNLSAINQGNNVVVQLVPASGRQHPYDIQVVYQLKQ